MDHRQDRDLLSTPSPDHRRDGGAAMFIAVLMLVLMGCMGISAGGRGFP